MSEPSQYRHIVPGPSPPAVSPPGDPGRSQSASWKKRVSTACLACKRSKRKCSGIPPCDNCRALNRECIFDESLDQRRRVAAKRTAEELTFHRDMLNDLFKVIRSAEQTHADRLLDIIRNDATPEDIRIYIDETLAVMQQSGKDGTSREATTKLKDIRRMVNLQGPSPSFRRKVMDVHFLCDSPPFRVPAKPWTTVTDDDEIVSHLVSLYFTWDYPFYAFLDCEVFVKHMAAANINSDFCTPFLVNALLANACHFSEFSEAYSVPGDVMTKGADYLAEAERLLDEQGEKVNLATLQGTLLLYGRYSMFGKDDMGYIMLNRAVGIARTLGYISDGDGHDSQMDLGDLSEDMVDSATRTAWGLYQVDTVAHTGFMRPNRIRHVRLRRPLRVSLEQDNAVWVPYPTHRAARPAFYSNYFDETCTLSEIAAEISRRLFSDEDSPAGHLHHRETIGALYERLKTWWNQLPQVFNPGNNPAPHILLLHMRYYTSVINLFSCWDKAKCSNKRSSHSCPPTSPESPSEDPQEIIISCAREIASLVRIHRREYSMSRSHAFALYAVNLALYVMLDQDPGTFDILDPDFLSLAAAFNIIASRSILGRNMFHIFRQSVRSKAQGSKAKASAAVSTELKELFDEEMQEGKWDDYAEGLQKLNEDARYPGIGADHEEANPQKLQDYDGFGLCDMLDRYESLSLGKNDKATQERFEPDGA